MEDAEPSSDAVDGVWFSSSSLLGLAILLLLLLALTAKGESIGSHKAALFDKITLEPRNGKCASVSDVKPGGIGGDSLRGASRRDVEGVLIAQRSLVTHSQQVTYIKVDKGGKKHDKRVTFTEAQSYISFFKLVFG